MSKDKSASETAKARRGRPRVDRQLARPNRIVTFVTDRELEALEQITVEEERSMAAVVHRIIAAHFGSK
jgi:hypothetical protein